MTTNEIDAAAIRQVVAVDDVRFPHADVAIASCVKRVHDWREAPAVGNAPRSSRRSGSTGILGD